MLDDERFGGLPTDVPRKQERYGALAISIADTDNMFLRIVTSSSECSTHSHLERLVDAHGQAYRDKSRTPRYQLHTFSHMDLH